MRTKKTAKRKIGQRPRPKKKKSVLRKIAKWHALLTLAVLVLYLGLGLWLGKGTLQRDIEGKIAGASILASVHIIGPPGKPVMSATPGCDSSSPYVELSWDATDDTDNYDIHRDSAALITGITATSYKDTGVSANTNYSYEVLANGPAGSIASDAVSATTGDCGAFLPDPTNRIITIENIDLTTYGHLPKIKNRSPTFTGTTNIVHALIRAELYTGPNIVSLTVANENGYWRWKVPRKLNYGLHTLYVTATDPSDSSRYKTAQITFRILRGEEKSTEENKEKTTSVETSLPATIAAEPAPTEMKPNEKQSQAPLDLAIEVKNEGKIAYFGSNLLTDLSILKVRDFSAGNNLVRYEIIDSRGNIVLESEETLKFEEGAVFSKTLKLPDYLRVGKYAVRAETEKESFIISAEDFFEGRERPILQLGGGIIITYTQLVSSLGYLFLCLFLLLVIFLLLLLREYWLAKQALFLVDEKDLAKGDYIS